MAFNNPRAQFGPFQITDQGGQPSGNGPGLPNVNRFADQQQTGGNTVQQTGPQPPAQFGQTQGGAAKAAAQPPQPQPAPGKNGPPQAPQAALPAASFGPQAVQQQPDFGSFLSSLEEILAGQLQSQQNPLAAAPIQLSPGYVGPGYPGYGGAYGSGMGGGFFNPYAGYGAPGFGGFGMGLSPLMYGGLF